jgi:predicted alpha/beta-hydrolase family hydrolase
VSAQPLLDALCGLLRRTYALTAPLAPIGSYVIGDVGLRVLYTGSVDEVRSESGEGARLLVRDTEAGVRACIYYPDAMIRTLEARPPQRGLNDDNVDAFAVLVEELDHLLVAAERAHAGRGVSLLELEVQANVSKHLVLSRFLLRPGRRVAPERRAWLRGHLFHARTYCDGDDEVRTRYEDASRMALRFLDVLERKPRGHRLETLRRFHRASLAGKAELSEGR